MRCTVAGLTPCVRAIVRTLQRVAATGVACSVASTILFTFAARIDRLRPRPGVDQASRVLRASSVIRLRHE